MDELEDVASPLHDIQGRACVVCYTSWDVVQSGPSRKMIQVVAALSKPHLRLMKMDCELFESMCDVYKVQVIPTLLLVLNGHLVARAEGAIKASEVAKLLAKFGDEDEDIEGLEEEAIEKQLFEQRLKQLITTAPVMVFMKGNPDAPRCGFSRKVCQLLIQNNIDFASFDILHDRAVREGLKKFADWPTYPQVYKFGELLGGLDILEQSVDDLKDVKQQSVDNKLTKLTSSAPVVLFMKGSPDQPRCGFSRSLCAILRERALDFKSFDVLHDDELRQGLKTFSNWPTFPQVYINATFVGGLDIVSQLHQDAKSDHDFKVQLGLLD